jgi:hypothetical protein
VKTRIPKLEHALTTRQKEWLHMIELVNGCDLFDKSAFFRTGELMAKARKKGLFKWILNKEIPEWEVELRRERSIFGKLLTRFHGKEFGDRGLIIKGSGHDREIIVLKILPEFVEQTLGFVHSGLSYK